jgi:hypothetical protein
MFYFMKEKHLMDQSIEVKCTVARRHWFQHQQRLRQRDNSVLSVPRFRPH